MSREGYYALALGLLAILVVVLQMIYPQISPSIGLPIATLLGVAAIIFVVRGIKKGERTPVKGSDLASRLFTIDVSDCKVIATPAQDGLQILELYLMLMLTAFPSQTIEGIYLSLHGKEYEEKTGAFRDMGKELFIYSSTFGQTVCFELPSKLRKGTYSAQIIIYVDGRKETQDFKFEY